MLPFVTPRYPFPNTKPIQIDRCIAPEVIELWNVGIETIESCCGHGQGGYIAVDNKHVPKMITIGYEYDTRTDAPGVFKSKTCIK